MLMNANNYYEHLKVSAYNLWAFVSKIRLKINVYKFNSFVINSRPWPVEAINSRDETVLTPNHLLTLPLSPSEFTVSEMY